MIDTLTVEVSRPYRRNRMYDNLKKLANELPYRERVEAYGLDSLGRVLSGIYENDRNIGVFGGGIDPGETPEQAAVREFLEESGYRLHNPQLLDVPPVAHDWKGKKKDDRHKQYRGSKTYFVSGDVGDFVPDEERGSDIASGLLEIRFRSLQNALRNMKPDRAMSPELTKHRREVIKHLIRELKK